jgi:hypothetical protein
MDTTLMQLAQKAVAQGLSGYANIVGLIERLEREDAADDEMTAKLKALQPDGPYSFLSKAEVEALGPRGTRMDSTERAAFANAYQRKMAEHLGCEPERLSITQHCFSDDGDCIIEDSDECYEEESASDTADEEIPLENQPEPELEMPSPPGDDPPAPASQASHSQTDRFSKPDTGGVSGSCNDDSSESSTTKNLSSAFEATAMTAVFSAGSSSSQTKQPARTTKRGSARSRNKGKAGRGRR